LSFLFPSGWIGENGRGLWKAGPESCVRSIDEQCAAAALLSVPSLSRGMGELDERHFGRSNA